MPRSVRQTHVRVVRSWKVPGGGWEAVRTESTECVGTPAKLPRPVMSDVVGAGSPSLSDTHPALAGKADTLLN